MELLKIPGGIGLSAYSGESSLADRVKRLLLEAFRSNITPNCIIFEDVTQEDVPADAGKVYSIVLWGSVNSSSLNKTLEPVENIIDAIRISKNRDGLVNHSRATAILEKKTGIQVG